MSITDAETEAFMTQMGVPNAGWSDCPMCGKHWLVTPREDCMVPGCGCYGEYRDNDPRRPCEPCGLAHAWNCSRRTEARNNP